MDVLGYLSTDESTISEEDFNIILDSHIYYFKNQNAINQVSITDFQNIKYSGDFLGLLNDLNIEKKYHMFIMKLNGYRDSCDFKGDKLSIIIPNLSDIEQLKNVISTKSL